MKTINIEQAHADIELIFRIILPNKGREPREGQISLAHTMLDALIMDKIATCDAGVGIGKTDAYIVAAIVAQKHKPKMLSRNTPTPFAIATSSISLQHAIADKYIPFLSDALLESGYIEYPITAEIRKGKQNYICKDRLTAYVANFSMENRTPAQRVLFRQLHTFRDLDKITGLTHKDRARLCVREVCKPRCTYAATCAYKKQLANETPAFFQVCNHHYLLADAVCKSQDRRPLLPHYRGLIVDEAHLFYDAVQSILGMKITQEDVKSLQKDMRRIHRNNLSNRMAEVMNTLFSKLADIQDGMPVFRSTKGSRKLINEALRGLTQLHKSIQDLDNRHILNKFERMTTVLYRFSRKDSTYSCLLEVCEDDTLALQVIEKNYHRKLETFFYNIGIVFTSGTLAVGRDMSFFKERMGLGRKEVQECQIPSPFDYENNSILYFASKMPKCSDDEFINSAATRIVELTNATAGHTLVLCTSHQEMHDLRMRINTLQSRHPTFAAASRNSAFLQAFLDADNGILLSTVWEGIDFPGDIVSSVIIPRLPFPRRDALHEGQKVNFKEVHDYVQAVAVPEMLLKLRQGTGRGMRLMTDTCAISILDCRAEERFCAKIQEALPPYPITYDSADVGAFVRRVKPQEYFNQSKGEIANA